ncbi:MAG: hypothetical protein KUG78_17130 [Kangiellaceae bacterium]|nr:hypothetical protein [Kangiellaceae bacterium]
MQLLHSAIASLAKAMGLEMLPETLRDSLIAHVLYDGEYNGVKGKNGFNSFNENLITAQEYTDLVMAHCSTKIANFNNVPEPGCDTFVSVKLCEKFETALGC